MLWDLDSGVKHHHWGSWKKNWHFPGKYTNYCLKVTGEGLPGGLKMEPPFNSTTGALVIPGFRYRKH